MKNKSSELFQRMFLMISLEINFFCMILFFFSETDFFTRIGIDPTIVVPIVFLVFFVLTILFSIVYFTFQLKDKKEKTVNLENQLRDLQKQLTVGYDKEREYIEDQITELQKKISDNNVHWVESYHLPLSAQIKGSYENVKYENFINKFGLKEDDFIVDSKMVFMLTPFSIEGNKVYHVTKKICSESGLSLYRGDEQHSNNDILDNIIKYIVKSRLIIANINGKNPNVFYELGIAHTLGKPVILICEADNELTNAFDIRQNNTVFYSNWDELETKLSKELVKILITD